MIHLGCGLEFHQLALIVEALAETKVSNPRIGNCLSFTEKKAISAGNPNTKSLVQIIREAGVDEKIVSVVTWDEPNKLENGPDSKVKEELAGHSKHRSVGPRQVKGEMTDLTNGAGLYIAVSIHAFAKFDKAFVAAASQLPTKIMKFDFFSYPRSDHLPPSPRSAPPIMDIGSQQSSSGSIFGKTLSCCISRGEDSEITFE